jgi:ubiquinone/menaquinone biosynthesis C-methylase UbiE
MAARVEPFDTHPGRYEAWFERHRAVYLSELAAVRNFVPPGITSVEIGVGSGRFAAPIGIRLGIDPSHTMLRRARDRGVEACLGVAEDLPLRSGRFRLALMVTTVCFVDSLEGAFREARRILEPGGHLVVGLVDLASDLGRTYERMQARNVFYRIATFYSAPEIEAALERAGLGVTGRVQTVFGDISRIDAIQDFAPGTGRGGFVVIRAVKPGP